MFDFLRNTQMTRSELVIDRRYAIISLIFAIAVLMSIYLSLGTGVSNILIVCALIWLLVLLLSGKRWLTDYKLLAREIAMALVPILSNTLDRAIIFTFDSNHKEETGRLLMESELITIENIIVDSDDMYTVFGDKNISISELLVTQNLKSADGKSKRRVNIFKGVFVVVELARVHDAETYISTDGDRSGFAHKTFWTGLLKDEKVKETQLECNDFEKDLYVATSDGSKAREILTPDFMSDLHDWWLEHKLNARIAFKGDKMFMLLPEQSIHISSTTTSTKKSAIKKYAMSLARPMWRSVVLVEDLNR